MIIGWYADRFAGVGFGFSSISRRRKYGNHLYNHHYQVKIIGGKFLSNKITNDGNVTCNLSMVFLLTIFNFRGGYAI